jgi:hypothetical protein
MISRRNGSVGLAASISVVVSNISKLLYSCSLRVQVVHGGVALLQKETCLPWSVSMCISYQPLQMPSSLHLSVVDTVWWERSAAGVAAASAASAVAGLRVPMATRLPGMVRASRLDAGHKEHK